MSPDTIELIQDLLEDKCQDIKNFLIGAIEYDDEEDAIEWLSDYRGIRKAIKEFEEYKNRKEEK